MRYHALHIILVIDGRGPASVLLNTSSSSNDSGDTLRWSKPFDQEVRNEIEADVTAALYTLLAEI